MKSFGKLDGIVLNHGMLGQVGKIAEAEPEQWKYGWDVNFLSLVAFVGQTDCLMGNKERRVADEDRSKQLFLRFVRPRGRLFLLRLGRRLLLTRVGDFTVPRRPP